MKSVERFKNIVLFILLFITIFALCFSFVHMAFKFYCEEKMINIEREIINLDIEIKKLQEKYDRIRF